MWLVHFETWPLFVGVFLGCIFVCKKRCLNCHFGAFQVHLGSCQTPDMKHVPNSPWEGIELRCPTKNRCKEQGFANNWQLANGPTTEASLGSEAGGPDVPLLPDHPWRGQSRHGPTGDGGAKETRRWKPKGLITFDIFFELFLWWGPIVMVHSLIISRQAEVEPFSIRYCTLWIILIFVYPKEPGLLSHYLVKSCEIAPTGCHSHPSYLNVLKYQGIRRWC